ncbi:retrovirus-related pol polyprotein from transposon TNT 1-94 [Tanacetum coccineum]
MGMVDNTLFTKKKSSNLIIVQIYVDDIIFGSTCQDMCDEFAKIMHDKFEMSMMGELNFFLGLQIKQMEDGIFFNQSKYIKEMLKKFGLEDSKPMKTPMSSDTKLTKDEECESVDSTKYRGMIGSLLYLTASRPDIMFSVCLCARFQEAPKTSHLEAVKRIFRYIKGTTHLGLWYPKGTGIETVVYADSDHAGDYVDRKSTSGICTFVGCCLTSWFSKKQTALAISTTEAEYVSAGKACQQALWMKQALIDYDERVSLPIGGDLMSWHRYPSWFHIKPIPPFHQGHHFRSIRIDQEGQVRRIRHEEEIDVHDYQILTREIIPTLKPLEEIIRENIFCLGVVIPLLLLPPLINHFSSYLNNDDDDGNNERTSHASTPSPIRYVNSLTNQVPQVFQNPPNIDPHLEPFYTHQTKIINRQVQLRDEHHGGVRSIRKSLRRLWRNMKK